MDSSLHDRKILKVFWPDSSDGQGRYLSSKENCDELYLSVDANEESWVVQINDGVEIARHNARYIETIIWAKV